MKKTTLLSIIILGLGTLSCSDFLDVESLSQTSEIDTFNDVSYTYSALVGAYGELIGDNAYGNRLSEILPQSGDDFKTSGDYNCNDRRGISMFAPCSSNPELNEPFKQLYSGIERANLCIFNIPKSTILQTGSDSDKEEMYRYLGEALALRAQFYYELIRNWGDVPFHDVPASQLESTFLPKTDRDVIYEQLLSDLEEAEQYVPWRSEASIPSTRFSKGAIKALRAKIALARAGYSLRRDPQLMTRGTNPEVYYQIAKEECWDIMQNRSQHDLNPSFEDLFRSLHEGREDNTHEIILEVGAFGGNSKTDSKLGYYNGLRHDAASSWNGGGGVNALPIYFYEFSKYDQRRDVTINIFAINKDNKTEIAKGNVFTDGKFRKSWTSITGTSQNLAVNWPLIRFADVLLMYAEADNELNNGPTPEAISAYEEVRARAFLGHESEMGTTPTTYSEFFDAIVQERYLEFGGESIRKYDLIRWNLIDTKFQEARQKLTDFLNGTGAYANVPDYIYYTAGTYDPSQTAQQVVTNLNIYYSGSDESEVFYNPAPSSVPSGYSQAAWRLGIDADYISSERKGFAQYFEPNRKELLPLYDDILNTNYNLTQDYGY